MARTLRTTRSPQDQAALRVSMADPLLDWDMWHRRLGALVSSWSGTATSSARAAPTARSCCRCLL
eukprot:2659234-Pyramimonas_sp.AAC.1